MNIASKYNSEEERNNEYLHVFKVNTLEDLNRFLSEETDEVVYRGMNNYLFKIISSSARKVMNKCLINNYIERIKRRYAKIINDGNRDIEAKDEFLKILKVRKQKLDIITEYFCYYMSKNQHFENISPFIDFTYEKLFALFFAFYKGSSDNVFATVYKVNKKNFNAAITDLSKELIDVGEIEIILETESLFRDFRNRNFALFIENDKIVNNKRLEAQKGCFIYRNPCFEYNEDLLQYCKLKKIKLDCFDINYSLRNNVEEILKKNNVTEKMLSL